MTPGATTADKFPATPPAPRSRSAAIQNASLGQATRFIRRLIWLYIVLWLIEGGLRRWFLPGLATPLLLVRDPLVIGIYCLALANGLFPINGFIVWGFLLGVLTFINAMMLGHGNLFVALYGVRCDFLHVPLIFIMGKILRPKDVMAMAKVAVWVAIPYTALLVMQFYQPQDAWINRGVGGNLDGAGFDGALDRFRPPGTFSFITGPAQLYPLFTACWFALLLSRQLPIWTMVASGAAILVSIPISISRTLFLSVVIVALTGVGAMVAGGRFSMKMVAQFLIAAAILFMFSGQSDIFQDGMQAFSARWETSTDDKGGFKGAIVDRVLDGLFGAFGNVRGAGCGTGFSTNVGQQLATQHTGFGAAEAEWGRLLYDNGFLLGSLMIAYRVLLASTIVWASYRAWRRRSTLSLVFAAASFLLLLNGQWGQTTSLGSAVIGGGLALASARKIKKPKPHPTAKPIRISLGRQ
jgi:hypothetical protein